MSAGPSAIRILAVDDHPLVRRGIATLVAGQADTSPSVKNTDFERPSEH
jgi:DNA-binding NarL/FixJ family response regulator